jgi:hypothetical protein
MKWFAANKLVLHLNKTNTIKFITNDSPHSALCIVYDETYVAETVNTKFFDLQIDQHLNWKNHIKQMIPKLIGCCYAVRSMFHINNISTLKSIYFTYFYSVIKYGIFCGGNSSNSGKVFTLQKKIFRIMVDAQPRTSCRSLFKKLEILPVPCQYILSLMNFIVNNQEHFQTNFTIQNINTRNNHNLHRRNANPSTMQKSTFYAGVRIFNSLPRSLTILKREKAEFKVSLRKDLNSHSFYSVDEFFLYVKIINNTVL